MAQRKETKKTSKSGIYDREETPKAAYFASVRDNRARDHSAPVAAIHKFRNGTVGLIP